MALLYFKKVVAIMLLLLILIFSDIVIVYGVTRKVTGALNNAVDAAIVTNLDNISLQYLYTDEELEALVKLSFVRTMEDELGARYYSGNFQNDGFLRNGLELHDLYTDWREDFPLVFARVNVEVDTVFVGLITDYNIVEIDNFDSLYMQWANSREGRKDWVSFGNHLLLL